MGRGAAIIGAQEARTRSFDRFASAIVFTEERGESTSSDGTDSSVASLPDSAIGAEATTCETGNAKAQLIPAELWFDLSATERDRFGQFFALMVFKDLGPRSCPTQEVTA